MGQEVTVLRHGPVFVIMARCLSSWPGVSGQDTLIS